MLSLRGPVLRLMMVGCFFASVTLLAIQAHSQSVVLECKITRIVVDGTREIRPDENSRSIYVYNEENQTLRVRGDDCSGVAITSDKITGYCSLENTEIDRTTGKLHARRRDRGQCSRGHYVRGRYECDEYEYETVDTYGKCQRQQKKDGVL